MKMLNYDVRDDCLSVKKLLSGFKQIKYIFFPY